MRKCSILILIFFTLTGCPEIFGTPSTVKGNNDPLIKRDTIPDNQTLYNGKIWRNLFSLVQGDQFLFTKDFLPGSLTIKGKTFNQVLLKYDIFKDELLTPLDSGKILQINKELIDSFSVSFLDKKYHFISIQEDSLKRDKSFYNVLYSGKTYLLIKFSKKIDKLSEEGKYDKFYQLSKIFLVKGNRFYPVSGKGDVLDALPEYKTQLKEYMKKNKIRISEKEPESFIPVVRFYDNKIQ